MSGTAKAKATVQAFRSRMLPRARDPVHPIADPDASGEQRFISMGSDPLGRVLVSVFSPRGRRTRIISSRKASRAERRAYEGQ
jgi:uncharacterized DUF497 family protein